MSAAISARAPLAQEGSEYWEDLIAGCQRQAHAINTVASEHGIGAGHFLECHCGPDLHIFKSHCPSTSVKVSINYCAWGPTLDGIITGQEDDDREFCPEEFSIPIARDLDGSVVAIFDEGRSFSANELAAFLMQSFRRCFPGLTLPCQQAVA